MADDAQRPSRNGSEPDAEPDAAEFERFERLTRLLITVPKEDVQRQAEREKKRQPAKR